MPETKSGLLRRFEELEISVKTYEHPAVYTVEESQALCSNIPGAHCKNLFLKDKKGNLWLVVCLEEAQIDLKSLPNKIGAARISFGKPDLLYETLGVEPGSVTPFSIINDTENKVTIVLAQTMMEKEKLNFHPLVNTATCTITASDLLRFIEACGHEPIIADID